MGSSIAVEYFARIKALTDEMASTGKELDDDEIALYLLVGLGVIPRRACAGSVPDARASEEIAACTPVTS